MLIEGLLETIPLLLPLDIRQPNKEVRFIGTSNATTHSRLSKKILTTAPLLVTHRTGPNESFVISTDTSNKRNWCIIITIRITRRFFKTMLLLC